MFKKNTKLTDARSVTAKLSSYLNMATLFIRTEWKVFITYTDWILCCYNITFYCICAKFACYVSVLICKLSSSILSFHLTACKH